MTNQNNIIGPIDSASWLTLVMLRGSIAFMKRKDINKYKIAIDKEENMYRSILKDYLPSNDNLPLSIDKAA